MQLLNKSKVRICSSPLPLDEHHRVIWRHSILRHQVRSYYADAPTDPLCAMDEHPCLRARPECIVDERGGFRKMSGELSEGEVLDPNLEACGL